MEEIRNKTPFYKKRDVQIIALMLLILLITMLFSGPSLFEGEESPNFVRITYGDGEVKEVPLGPEQIVTIEQENGAVNKICIYEDGVYMYSSTCANQDCVAQGHVTLENYESRILSNFIICLPNQVAVELIVKEAEE